ncbi:MAG: LysR substrate-binding domain-containing protein [Halieaceae bacterium]|nr:LysR substrate-binding domain-containing protein [Halieaceae bacterium]
MESKWLEDYLALVKHGSFTKAAEARHITQPAFSRRIRALENWLGTDLVDRNAYPAKLTPAGDTLVDDIHQLLEHTRSLQRKAGDHNKLSDSITVATQHSLSVSVCPKWFQTIRPILGVRNNLRVNAANMHDCIEQFLAGNADLLLCYHSELADPLSMTEGLSSASLGPDELIPVIAKDQSIQLSPKALSSSSQPLPVIAFPNESFFGQLIQSAIDSNKCQAHFDPVYITAQSESVHELVRQGIGLAWLPESLVAPDIANNVLIKLPLPAVSLDIRLYWRKTDDRVAIQSITQHHSVFLKSAL